MHLYFAPPSLDVRPLMMSMAGGCSFPLGLHHNTSLDCLSPPSQTLVVGNFLLLNNFVVQSLNTRPQTPSKETLNFIYSFPVKITVVPTKTQRQEININLWSYENEGNMSTNIQFIASSGPLRKIRYCYDPRYRDVLAAKNIY